MNKVKKFTHKVFYDNKALLIFSFVLAVIIWLVVMLGFAPIDTRKISGIVVVVESQGDTSSGLDLQPFGFDNNTIDITIEGKRYAIYDESVDKDSFKAVAKTTYVSTPGKYALQIEVSKLNEKGEYEIIELSQDYVEVYFDVLKEVDKEIAPNVISSTDIVDDGYIAGEPYLTVNKVKINNIKVSGPANEVNAIQNILGEVTVETPLDKTTTWDAVINAYNDKNGLVHNLTYMEAEDIQITQPVYRIVDTPVNLVVDFINMPQSFSAEDIEYKIEFKSDSVNPDDVKVAVEDLSIVNKNNELSIKTIDFDELKPGKNTITIKPEKLTSVYFLEDIEEITITVTLIDFAEKTFEFDDDNIIYNNKPEDYSIEEIKKSIGPVTVYGPKESLENLQASNIFAEVDLSKVKVNEKEQTITADIDIRDNEDCWAYGTYTITIVQP